MADFPIIDFGPYEWVTMDQNYIVKWNGKLVALNELQANIAAFGNAVTLEKNAAVGAAQNASEAQAKAQEWAESEDEVEPGARSAKYWAGQAEQVVTGDTAITALSPGTLNTELDYVSVDAQGALVRRNLADDLLSGAVLPSLVGNALKKLGVKADESGLELQEDPPAFEVGQIILSAPTSAFEGFLRLDNSTIFKAAYPQLSNWVDSVGGSGFYVLNPFIQQANLTTTRRYAVHYDGTQWLSVGDSGIVETSPDGISWTDRVASGANLSGVYGDGSLWVAVGGSGGAVITSPDGITWTSRTTPTSEPLKGVHKDNNFWVAVGGAGSARAVITSPDGITWTNRTLPSGAALNAVHYDGSLWVAVGDNGSVITSPDAINWTSRSTLTQSSLSGVFGDGQLWVAVGSGGTIITSRNGIDWGSVASPTTNTLLDVHGDGNIWLIVGATGLVLASPSAFKWSVKGTTTGNALYGVYYGGGIWLSVGNAGEVITATYDLDILQLTPNEGGYTGYIKAEVA